MVIQNLAGQIFPSPLAACSNILSLSLYLSVSFTHVKRATANRDAHSMATKVLHDPKFFCNLVAQSDFCV